ncbi:MAG: heme-binding protein [Planctomycetes bacterium]|nr:heme-binding protein [Planctomycetota bacterium]
MLEWTLVVLMALQGDLPKTAPDPAVRALVARALGAELARAADAEGDAARLEALRSVIAEAVRELGPSSRIGAALGAASDAAARGDVEERLAELRAFVRERALDLTFAPRVESPRPAGFPAATPVGEFAVLDYPAYRMARAAVPEGWFGGRNGAFWKLFRHIQKHEISMTAPVEMSYSRVDAKVERIRSMAFLYASIEIGELGKDGDVEVVDIAAARVLSIGLRGSDDNATFERALAGLRAWLAQHPEWLECGPARVFGWNSPMVVDAERFHEVQLPIRAAPPKSGADASTPASRE